MKKTLKLLKKFNKKVKQKYFIYLGENGDGFLMNEFKGTELHFWSIKQLQEYLKEEL